MNAFTKIPVATAARPAPKLPTYDARQLVGEAGQASFVLDDQVYNLRITKAGKLILTK